MCSNLKLAVSSTHQVFREVFDHDVVFVNQLAVRQNGLNLVLEQTLTILVLVGHSIPELADFYLELELFVFGLLCAKNFETFNHVFQAVLCLWTSRNQ